MALAWVEKKSTLWVLRYLTTVRYQDGIPRYIRGIRKVLRLMGKEGHMMGSIIPFGIP